MGWERGGARVAGGCGGQGEMHCAVGNEAALHARCLSFPTLLSQWPHAKGGSVLLLRLLHLCPSIKAAAGMPITVALGLILVPISASLPLPAQCSNHVPLAARCHAATSTSVPVLLQRLGKAPRCPSFMLPAVPPHCTAAGCKPCMNTPSL